MGILDFGNKNEWTNFQSTMPEVSLKQGRKATKKSYFKTPTFYCSLVQ